MRCPATRRCTHCVHAKLYFYTSGPWAKEGAITCPYRHGPDHNDPSMPHGAFRELAPICDRFKDREEKEIKMKASTEPLLVAQCPKVHIGEVPPGITGSTGPMPQDLGIAEDMYPPCGQMKSTGTAQEGPEGFYGPNDIGYMIGCVREAASRLYRATDLYCEGHYPHSNARRIPDDHPIVRAMKSLEEFDKEFAHYANKKHDPDLFKPHLPTEEAMTRWDGYAGPPGIP